MIVDKTTKTGYTIIVMSSKPLPGTGQLVDQVVELKSTLGQFARLIEISLTLNSTLDLDNILYSILETASDVLACEAVSILLYDETTEELRFVASTDSKPEELSKIAVPLENSIAGTIFLQNAPQVINNLSSHPMHFQMVSKRLKIENKSLIGVPMRIRDQVIGVLEGINKKDGNFGMEDVDILSVIASQAAVAISNARMMQSLQAAFDELRQIDKLKSDFIAIASHELRTPLFHILGYAQLLKEETQGESSENAQRVFESAKLLQSLVDDMTNMNLLEMRAQELDKQKIPAQVVLAAAYQEVRPAIEAKKQRSSIHLPKAPIFIMADQEKLTRVFINVLNNAVRFTPEEGQIEIRLSRQENHAHFSIQDNGIGIPPKKLDSIFNRFNQVESHMTRSYGGLGLSLPIARGLVELHGGKIWAESEGIGKGTRIVATLPVSMTTPPFISDDGFDF